MFGAKLRSLVPVGLVGAAAVASVFVLASLGISAAAAKSDGIRGGAHGILFSFAQPSNANNAFYGGDLYRWRLGGQPVRLTSNGLRNWARWSPDGKLIAFTMLPGWDGQGSCGSLGCAFQLFVMRADGTGETQLTHDGDVIGSVTPDSCCFDAVSWSPDGRTLVFAREHEDGPIRLFVISAHGGEETPLHVIGARPAWGPQGIAYSSVDGLRVLNPKTHRSKLVTRAQFGVNANAWSPDGKRLAAIPATPGHYAQRIAVYTYSGRKLASFRAPAPRMREDLCGLSWSPDGKHLLVTVSIGAPLGEPPDYYHLYEVRPNGTHWRRLPNLVGTCSTSWR